jgi:hypothetical protein
MDYVAEAKSHVDSLNGLAIQISEEIVKRRDELVAISQDVLAQREIADASHRSLEESKALVAEEQINLSKAVKALALEKQKLETDVGLLASRVGKLKVKSAELDAENAKFKAYEEKAWKSLTAKEQSLMEREATIVQKENLRPGRKTLLPPME